jgi:phenylacetic acid degradation operon negative regulatory protein
MSGTMTLCLLLCTARIVSAVPAHLAEGPETGVDLPRSQTGAPPQHLLVTLLGDYCLPHRPHLPSAALVGMVGEFGISQMGARAALSRLARRGVVEHSKSGRRTYYRLTRDAATVLVGGSRRIAGFADEAEHWDGEWTAVAFSVPENRREARHLLRSRLRWQGFAPLYDGLWVSPHATAEDAAATMDDLEIGNATVFRARHTPAGSGRAPIQAWDLDGIAETYLSFLQRWRPVVEALRSGDIHASAALVARTEIMDTYRRFPALDPQLPMALMPPAWPRTTARDLFAEAYDWLGPLAVVRVRQLVSETAPELAELVVHHTTADLLAQRIQVTD